MGKGRGRACRGREWGGGERDGEWEGENISGRGRGRAGTGKGKGRVYRGQGVWQAGVCFANGVRWWVLMRQQPSSVLVLTQPWANAPTRWAPKCDCDCPGIRTDRGTTAWADVSRGPLPHVCAPPQCMKCRPTAPHGGGGCYPPPGRRVLWPPTTRVCPTAMATTQWAGAACWLPAACCGPAPSHWYGRVTRMGPAPAAQAVSAPAAATAAPHPQRDSCPEALRSRRSKVWSKGCAGVRDARAAVTAVVAAAAFILPPSVPPPLPRLFMCSCPRLLPHPLQHPVLRVQPCHFLWLCRLCRLCDHVCPHP